MALTLDELALVRAEVGDTVPPSDDDLDEIHDRRGGLVGVVREVWSKRLADLLASPASFTVSGEYGQNVASNILGIQQRLRELAGADDTDNEIPPGGTVLPMKFYQLVRAGQDR